MAKKFLPLLLAFVPFLGQAQLIVTEINPNPQQNLDELAYILMPPGTQISNVQYIGSTGVYARSIGKFNGDSSNIGINNGIIMTTGLIKGEEGPHGPNTQPDAGTHMGRLGPPAPFDSLMAAQVGNSLHDATLLHFSFFSGPMQSLSFQYVFASEEYNEFVGTAYKDMFAIYIQALGSPLPTNFARLPIFGQPIISPTTVNNGYNTGCSDGTNATNPQFYVDNCDGETIQYDGFTVPLTATAPLNPNTFYHIWFIIADVGDNIYDSGVFLKGVYQNAGISENPVGDDSIYPNPSNGTFYLKDLAEPTQVILYDMAGQAVWQQNYTQTGTVEINPEHLAAGIYTLIQRGEHGTRSSKIIIRK